MKLNQFSVIAISLLTSISFTACGSSSSSSDGNTTAPEEEVNKTVEIPYSVQPYLRVAELDGDWNDTNYIARTIADYINETDESTETKLENFPTNWIVAGVEAGEKVEESDILGIPIVVGDTVQKIQMVELCNKSYATLAVNTGNFHASALPCQVSVHSENGKVYIDILDPEAIFSLFFYDLNQTQKDGLKQVALDVKREITDMIYASLSYNQIEEKNISMGPIYSENQFADLNEKNPFKIFNYSDGEREFSMEDLSTIAEAIIHKLGDEETPSTVEDISEGSGWRSARTEAIPIPQSKVIEACSPKYAKMATALGAEYTTSLPCEITVTRKNDDNRTLQISYLNPEYMFGVMFGEDALKDLNESEKVEFMALPTTVFTDLKLIVDSAIEELKNKGSFTLDEKVPAVDNTGNNSSGDYPPTAPF